MDAALRDERLRDGHRAPLAGIGTNVANLGLLKGLQAERQANYARMPADPGFVPFIPKKRDERICRACVTDIHILPRNRIDAVVACHVRIERIAALGVDMRGDGCRGLEQDRPILRYAIISR